MRFCILISALLSIVSATYSVAQTVNYEIYALQFAQRTHRMAISEIAVGSQNHDSTGTCFMYWLLKGTNGKKILVDAGFYTDTEINPYYIQFQHRPDSLLLDLGIQPGDITDIILTHPHWDHIGGIDLYPNAMVWMQEMDYNYFVGSAWQMNGNNDGFNKNDVLKIVQKNLNGKLTLVKGDNIEIMPNIKVFTGSKHTCESQYVLVESKEGNTILASDNTWFYYNLTSLLPIPVTHDSNAYTQNLKRMKIMVDNIDFIVPGHDPLVFTKFKKVNDNIVQIR